MGLGLPDGGHLTHGYYVSSIPYPRPASSALPEPLCAIYGGSTTVITRKASRLWS